MDFARKQLEKYGWTDGKGLGKNENGIAEPIKPKLKRSVAGIGHDAAADFTEFWWSQLYDKAAKNVEVKEKNGKTKKIKTKEAEFKITNSTYQLSKSDSKKAENEEYSDFFVKTIVLTNGGTQERLKEELEEKEKKRDVFQLTEEELFAACEGRTAHKGARHGLRATGKLARIERQEQELLAQDKYTGYSHSKKIKKNKPDPELNLIEEDTDLIEETDRISKKKKNKSKCIEKCSENSLSVSELGLMEENINLGEESGRISKNKKKKAVCKEQSDENGLSISELDLVEENTNLDEDSDRIPKKKKKKSICKEQSDENGLSISELDLVEEKTNLDEDSDRISKKKKKKSKCKEKIDETNSSASELYFVEENTNSGKEIDGVSKKKKNRSKSEKISSENHFGTELEMAESNIAGPVDEIINNIDISFNKIPKYSEVKKKSKQTKKVTDVIKSVKEEERSKAKKIEIMEDYSLENEGTSELKKSKKRAEKLIIDDDDVILEQDQENKETVIIKKKDKKRKVTEIVQNEEKETLDVKKSKKYKRKCE